jgi:cyclopropane fatty-acyl-phospholipid synthase-like methyltransferase
MMTRTSATERLAAYPALREIVSTVLAQWPQHQKFADKSIAVHDANDLAVLEGFGHDILTLTEGHLAQHCAHYRWMCDTFTKEAMHFFRTGEYRCKTFADAVAEVYGNREFMAKYMDGLLISQVLWANHAQSAIYYKRHFLAGVRPGASYLEIGPGHGLFLAQAARDPRVASATAWDVSPESIDQARRALGKLGVTRSVSLQQRDVLGVTAEAGSFDAIVISEVLEHMEDPRSALQGLRRCIAADGRILVNVPINSPAPDHIYLLRSPDDAAELVRSGGFEIADIQSVPMTGYTLEQAREGRLTITSMITARPNGKVRA